MELLTRDQFREGVFKRDHYKCVNCGKPAQDSHHIVERRLFPDGGYYLDNGASLCGECHILAEETTLDAQELRDKIGITNIVLPPHLYRDQPYDKWGNPILPNGNRLKGELFYDESVQKIIRPQLHLFTKHVKYPRTYHLPWSNLLKDDRIIDNDEHFQGQEIVVTLKLDGENTTMYNDYIHARSINSGSHPSRNWVKGLWSQIGYLLDENMRVCGENLYAVHSIQYENLKSYFYLFSVWIDETCLDWDETVEYSKILGLETVPVIYRGIYSPEKIQESFKPYENTHEGYVVRLVDEFKYGEFRTAVAKFVHPRFREMINNSHGHWISKKMEINQLQ